MKLLREWEDLAIDVIEDFLKFHFICNPWMSWLKNLVGLRNWIYSNFVRCTCLSLISVGDELFNKGFFLSRNDIFSSIVLNNFLRSQFISHRRQLLFLRAVSFMEPHIYSFNNLVVKGVEDSVGVRVLSIKVFRIAILNRIRALLLGSWIVES